MPARSACAWPRGRLVDFGAAMERMRRLRAGVSRHDSAAASRSLGVDVFLGEGRFSGPDTVEVGEAGRCASRRL